MKVQKGNLFDSGHDWLFVTGNSYINVKGALVMGRGAALYIKQNYTELPYEFGTKISRICGSLGRYDVLTSRFEPFGIFQVKRHYGFNAELGLIESSVKALNSFVRFMNVTVGLNFPGIGNGRLDIYDVAPIIKELDDRVTVYYL